ncbi:protein MFI isoform X3 [Pungitius pungitius]|uniref:protein MFI isoform X3 n=1 Tax=Pungitius pungitius TaxID=134920 RepID=UPI002E0FD7CC
MSMREEGPREPRRSSLQHEAARVIQRTWRSHVLQNREVFKYFKELISHCNQRDPREILKTVNPREAQLLDAAAGVFIRIRLGGIAFPPNIYYKIFTHAPIVDVCASSPKDYTKPGLQEHADHGRPPMQDRSGWYQRTENNNWRLFCRKVVPTNEPKETGANKKMDFHYSRLQRQKDVGKWRKKRKIEWLTQMYNQGRLQTQPVQQHVVALLVDYVQQAMEAIEERRHEEILDRELDELMAWTNTLNFEEYMQDWRCLACTHSSERTAVRAAPL